MQVAQMQIAQSQDTLRFAADPDDTPAGVS
jgi:hypothetical protein